MPKAYSLDLRERVARFVGSGRSRHAAAGAKPLTLQAAATQARHLRELGQGHSTVEEAKRDATASLDSRRFIDRPQSAAIDKGANTFDPPGGGSRPEFHGLWEAAGFDPRPPCRFADGNRPFGTEDRIKPDKARFGKSETISH